MKCEFYKYNLKPIDIDLLVYNGSGNEFLQYETDKFKNLRDASGNIKPIFIASENPSTNLNITYNDKSEFRITDYSLFAGLLEIQRNLSFPIYPSRLESLIGNLGCVKQKEYEESEKIYLVLPSVKSDILITSEVDYENVDYEGMNSEIKQWLENDELEFELLTFLGFSHGDMMSALTTKSASDLDEHVKKILNEMFEKNKNEYLPYPFDEVLLYWENSLLINKHVLDYPIDFCETLIYGENKLVMLSNIKINN
ncbi:MAG: hypothetical protein KF816_06515 [Melioribacteraceae bacterium]|nr:hypothetical protein [Melioribacteraceae bacterium]